MNASERNSLISNVGFGVGIAGGIVGTYLMLTSQAEDGLASRNTYPAVRARLGVGQVNIEGSF